jgi:GNAT superfamily N-acetyltransferase
MRQVRPARPNDIAGWLELAAEVEHLFGPMPDLATHITRGIERGTAMVVAEGDEIVAAALLSRDDASHEIHWLSVRRRLRRAGAGRLLLDEVLRRWPTGDIQVVTFGRDVPGGEPARKFYTALGFVAVGATDPAPDGTSRDRFVLTRRV